MSLEILGGSSNLVIYQVIENSRLNSEIVDRELTTPGHSGTFMDISEHRVCGEHC